MFWLVMIIVGTLACLFVMLFFLRKAYYENTCNIIEYDNSSTNWKVMVPFLIGISFPQLLYYFGGIKKWLSISTLVLFTTLFLFTVYSNRKKVKSNIKTKQENV